MVSVKEKASPRGCQVKGTETSVSEPLRTCRKSLGDVKTGGSFVTPGAVWEEPVYSGLLCGTWEPVAPLQRENRKWGAPMSGRVPRRSTGAESFVVGEKGL